MHAYVENVIDKIQKTISSQEEELEEVSEIIAESITDGGILHVLGTGHSHMLAEEIFYRAGGPIFTNPILDPALMLHNGTAKSSRLERLSGYAKAILEDVDLQSKDIFLVISNSGRNPVPIEAMLYAKERDLTTLAITSLKHSRAVDSRHTSGKLADFTFDNYGEIGDTSLKLKNSDQHYGPTSSAVGIVLIQTLISLTIEKLEEKGVTPPLLRSANLDDADASNRKNIQKYINRIPLLK